MDERNKIISELEEKRRQDLAASEETLAKLGKNLLARLEDFKTKGKQKKAQVDQIGAAAWAEVSRTGSQEAGMPEAVLEEYRCLLAEIVENEGQIRIIEAENADYQELLEDIASKEKKHSKDSREISSLYVQTGRLVLEDPSFKDFSAAYQSEAGELLENIDARESRLEELEQKTGNFFSMIGKGAESLVVKTLLLKNQADLQKIYRVAGEKFILSGENFDASDEELKEAAGEAGKLKVTLEELVLDLARLKEERKKITDRFRGEGDPDWRIKNHERQIFRIKEDITNSCRRFGGYVLEREYTDYFNAILNEEDKKDAAQAASFLVSAEEHSVMIGKLKAAVAIDGEKAGIERLKKSIDSEGRKIKNSKEAIADMEKDIKSAENRIDELKELL